MKDYNPVLDALDNAIVIGVMRTPTHAEGHYGPTQVRQPDGSVRERWLPIERPGAIIEKLPEEQRKILRTLTSDDTRAQRPFWA